MAVDAIAMILGGEDWEMDKLSLEAYVIDSLLPDLVGHDRHPTAFLVYLYLYADAVRSRRMQTCRSLNEIADAVGVSRRGVQAAVARLKKRQLLVSKQEYATAASEYTVKTPWRK